MHKIAILGAGISGLAIAWYLQKTHGKNISLTIYEKENRPGGWIRSIRSNGYFFECGPRSFRKSDSEEALCLIKDLELENDLLQADASARQRFLYHQDNLEPLPRSIKAFFTSPLTRHCFWAMLQDLIASKSEDDDESVKAFFKRRFGNAIVEQFIDPLVKGIYAGDVEQLSMQACFPKIWENEQKFRSLIWASMRNCFQKKKQSADLWTLKNGLESIVIAIVEKLQAEIRLNSSVDQIFYAQGKLHISSKDHVEIYDSVISTLPAFALAKVITDQNLQNDLNTIPYASICTINMGFPEMVHSFKGLGYLVPEYEKEDLLGVIFDSCSFPQQNGTANQTRLTVMLGGVHRSHLLKEGIDYCAAIAKKALKKHLQISVNPEYINVSIAENAIPQYPIGFSLNLKKMQHTFAKKYPGLLLLGTSYFGVSVNQSIGKAKQVASEYFDKNWHRN